MDAEAEVGSATSPEEGAAAVEPQPGTFEVTGRPEREAFVYLLGHAPIGEFLGFALTSLNAPGQAQLMNDWRAANAELAKLALQQIGISDGAVIAELPEHMRASVETIVQQPLFQASYSAMPTAVGIVDLQRVVVHQKMINLSQVERLRRYLDASRDVDLVGFCIGSSVARPAVKSQRVGNAAFTFTSPSNDLRVLEPVLLTPDQVIGHSPGVVERYIALPVGYGINALNVYHISGRLILGNGSHRAFALMDKGITEVPAVVQEVGSLEELALVCPPVSASPAPYLTNPRPPLLVDYFNPALTARFERPSTVRLVKAGFGSEIQDL